MNRRALYVEIAFWSLTFVLMGLLVVATATAQEQITHDVVMDVPEGIAGGSFDVVVHPGISKGVFGDLDCSGEFRVGDVVELFRHWVEGTTGESCPAVPVAVSITTAIFPDFGITRYDQITPQRAKVSFADGNRLCESALEEVADASAAAGPCLLFTLVLDMPVPATTTITITCLQCDDDSGNVIDVAPRTEVVHASAVEE